MDVISSTKYYCIIIVISLRISFSVMNTMKQKTLAITLNITVNDDNNDNPIDNNDDNLQDLSGFLSAG